MKKYILVLLTTGDNQSKDETYLNNCFRGHMDNINRLVEQEKLTVAGPFFENDKNYRGIFILNVPTIEDAKKLLENDTAIQERILFCEFIEWYGSAALPEYLEASEKIWKIKP
jgi:uncharacterized protein